MTIYDFVQDWTDTSLDRKILALKRVLKYIENNEDDALAEHIFNALAELEADDYFGTEGLNV